MRKADHLADRKRPLILFLSQTRGLTFCSDGDRLVEGRSRARCGRPRSTG